MGVGLGMRLSTNSKRGIDSYWLEQWGSGYMLQAVGEWLCATSSGGVAICYKQWGSGYMLQAVGEWLYATSSVPNTQQY